jgi:uncharacterized protein YfaS (alpha-2-macroglobulin family)
VTRAISYLRHAQNADGGFGQMKADDSNAQSTAWAVQGLVSAQRNPRKLRRNGHDPMSYLVSLQQANGAVRYSRTSAQSPVWVTAEALTALAEKPYPIAAPPRKSPVGVAKSATKKRAAAAAPIAHIANKSKSKRKKHHATTPAARATPTPTATIAGTPVANETPSTTHERRHKGNGDLPLALGGAALAMILVGTYLTRRRLRGRSKPA